MIGHIETVVQEFNARIPGVVSAHKHNNRNLDSDELPACLARTLEGRNKNYGSLWNSNRFVRCFFYYKTVTSEDFASLREGCEELYNAVFDTYMALFNAESEHVLDYGESSGVRVEIDRSREMPDSGIRYNLEWYPESDIEYIGFWFDVPILAQWGSGL